MMGKSHVVGQFATFGWAGVVAALSNLAVAAAARELGGLSVGASYLLSFSVVLCLSFVLCRYTVFRATAEDVRWQFAKFAVSSIVFRGLELAACYALYKFLGVHYFVALLLVQLSSFLIKFVFYRAIVFSAGDSAST